MTFEKLAYEVKGLEILFGKAETMKQLEMIHNKKQPLIDLINSTLETGFWQGANYEMLHALKSDLYTIEKGIENKAIKLWSVA